MILETTKTYTFYTRPEMTKWLRSVGLSARANHTIVSESGSTFGSFLGVWTKTVLNYYVTLFAGGQK